MQVLHLQYVRPDGENEVFHLKDVRPYHLGRGSVCEVRILDMKMSRKHAVLEAVNGHWTITDLGSTNGVRLDGTRTAGQAILERGMRIALGNTVLAVAGITGHLDLDPSEATYIHADDGQDDTEVQIGNAADSPPPPASETVLDAPPPVVAPPREAREREGEKEETKGPPPVEAPPPTMVAEPAADAGPSAGFDNPADGAGPAVGSTDPAPTASEPEPTAIGPEPAAKAPAPTTTPSPASGPPGDDVAADPTSPTGAYRRTRTGSHVYLSLLGQRIGPVERDQARALKAKELRGILTEADLVGLPRA